MDSLFLFLNIFSQFYSSSSTSHTYRSPWRWKIKGGVVFCFMEMQKKTGASPSFCLQISLPLLHHFPTFFLILCLHYSACTTFSCHIAIFDIIVKSLYTHPSYAVSVSSWCFQILEIKIEAVCPLMKSTKGQP